MKNERSGSPRADFGRRVLISLLLAGLVAVCYRAVDIPAAIWARGLDPGLVRAFRVVSAFGYSGPYLAVLALIYPITRFRLMNQLAAGRALFVFAVIALSGLAVNLVKWVAGRWRPDPFFDDPSRYGFEFFEIGYKHNSFPSGHATTAWSLACALALLFPRLWGLWYGAAVLVGLSRVIVGSHYPGDVLAGAWLGVVVALGVSRAGIFRDALARAAPAVRGV